MLLRPILTRLFSKGSTHSLPANLYTATVYTTTAEIPAVVWNSHVPSTNGKTDNPFLDHAFFLGARAIGLRYRTHGWQPQHLTINGPEGTPVGLMPLFLKSHSMGEYVFDHGWANALERAGGSYYPKLQCSVPFTPATAPKLLVPSGDAHIQAALLAAAQQLALERDASSVHATFVPEAEADLIESDGWLKRVDTQFHWHNEGFSPSTTSSKPCRPANARPSDASVRDALADGLTVKWLTAPT